jgi:CxxC motif-containing protein
LGEGGIKDRMKKLKTSCHACRNNCELVIKYKDGEVIEVIGNGCMRGMMHAQSEVRRLEENDD